MHSVLRLDGMSTGSHYQQTGMDGKSRCRAIVLSLVSRPFASDQNWRQRGMRTKLYCFNTAYIDSHY